MLPIKFQDNWPFVSGEKAKIDFQDGGQVGFPIGTILAIFFTMMLPSKFQNWPFVSREKAKK